MQECVLVVACVVFSLAIVSLRPQSIGEWQKKWEQRSADEIAEYMKTYAGPASNDSRECGTSLQVQ